MAKTVAATTARAWCRQAACPANICLTRLFAQPHSALCLAFCHMQLPYYIHKYTWPSLLDARQAKHRRIRRWEVLWEVQSLARHWTALQQRKERLQQHVQACLDAAESPAHAEAFQACLTALDDVASMEVLFSTYWSASLDISIMLLWLPLPDAP